MGTDLLPLCDSLNYHASITRRYSQTFSHQSHAGESN